MVRKLATKFLALTLAVLMAASTISIPTNAQVYVSEFTVQEQSLPQSPVESFRNTEVVSLNWFGEYSMFGPIKIFSLRLLTNYNISSKIMYIKAH